MSTTPEDRKSTRLNSSHTVSSYAVFCLKKKSAGGFEPARPGGTEVVHAKVDRHVSARRPDDGPDREPHRDIHEGREEPPIHQPLQDAMLRTCLPPQQHVARGSMFDGDPEPRMEGGRGDASSQILYERGVIVHPNILCGA